MKTIEKIMGKTQCQDQIMKERTELAMRKWTRDTRRHTKGKWAVESNKIFKTTHKAHHRQGGSNYIAMCKRVETGMQKETINHPSE